jgi:excisionase family DNA binding protein
MMQMKNKISIPKVDYEKIIDKVSQLENEVAKLKEMNSLIPEKERYMDIKNACILLGISRANLYRIMERGELGYTLIGRQRRLLIVDLEEYFEKQRKEALDSIL